MKKNFLTTVAISVVAFFAATEIARAADVSFSGQLRTRYEFREHKDPGAFDDSLAGNDLTATRMRLNANVNINDSTSAFIQMQSARTWGSNGDSLAANDTDGSVGIHQAYFTLKSFATLPADLKLGRQEVVMDGHRLFGHTGWTTGAQTHDAIRLTHKGGNHTLSYVYMLAKAGTLGKAGTDDDYDVHLLHANFQGVLGGGLSLYFVGTQDERPGDLENNIYTVGFRQAGQLFGINYRGEYYHQFGDANADAGSTTNTRSTFADGDVDRDAYMFGVRVGKKFNNVMMKPSLTIWYDQLSGTDETDGAETEDEWGTFNTLFDTGHKFYGHMDLFLDSVNHATKGLGLTDFAIKGSLQPMPGWTVKAAYHWFGVEADPANNADDDLGTELDLALIHKYNANTVISAGYSYFDADDLFHTVKNHEGDNGAEWVYVQLDVKF